MSFCDAPSVRGVTLSDGERVQDKNNGQRERIKTMTTDILTVVANVRARAGSEAGLLELLRTLPGPTRQEAGCIRYDLHQSETDPTMFLFFEQWRSQADLDLHLASPHVTAVLAKVGPLVAEPPQITTWRKVA